MRPKWLAAIRTLARQSHYLAERFVSGEFLRTATPLWLCQDYSQVVFSQIGVASIAAQLERESNVAGRHLIIETHNNDYTWFQAMVDSSRNALLRSVARTSVRWVDQFLRENATNFIFVHISEQDQVGYQSKHPCMRSFVSPPGTDIHPLKSGTGMDHKIRLLCVGSLGVRMNLDALLHFRETFHGPLLDRFGDLLEVTVVGNDPSSAVRNLCQTMNWALFPNVSDEELDSQYSKAAFSLLPFPYTSGAKLKLLDTLSHGVPFLATGPIADQVENPASLFPCLFSDDPQEWVQRVEQVQKLGTESDFAQPLLSYARQYTWENLAERHFSMLQREISRL